MSHAFSHQDLKMFSHQKGEQQNEIINVSDFISNLQGSWIGCALSNGSGAWRIPEGTILTCDGMMSSLATSRMLPRVQR